MKSKAIILAATCAFALAFAGCSDSVVGTDDEATTTLVKKVKPPPVPDDDPTDFRSVTVTFMDDAGDRIRSDGRGDYVDGNCGVWANIGNFADARFDPDREYKPKLARSCGDPRALVFEFPDWRGTRTVGAFMNINKIDNLAPGQFFTDSAQFNVCNTLVFEEVKTTRNSETTWTVTTNGASDVAVCADGSVYAMPFTLTITE
ncbi:MAG: hypothetical protein WBO43_03060 [Gemmatimonadota bacterium]|jgi:hypothetical protein